jgi:hypothetical protein
LPANGRAARIAADHVRTGVDTSHRAQIRGGMRGCATGPGQGGLKDDLRRARHRCCAGLGGAGLGGAVGRVDDGFAVSVDDAVDAVILAFKQALGSRCQ